MPTGRCIQRFETFLTGTTCSRICFPEISRLSKGRLQIMAAGILGMNRLGHLCSTTLDLPARNILAQVYEWKEQLHQFRLVQDRDLWLRWHLWLLKLHEHFRRRHLRCFEFEFWNWWHCRTDLQTRCQEDGTCHAGRHEVTAGIPGMAGIGGAPGAFAHIADCAAQLPGPVKSTLPSAAAMEACKSGVGALSHVSVSWRAFISGAESFGAVMRDAWQAQQIPSFSGRPWARKWTE